MESETRVPKNPDEDLGEEAAAFNRRITERRNNGFVPDLRRAVKCEYFYKSFWRDPHYIELYLGRVVEQCLNFLNKYSFPGARILDVGCGAGYLALEWARHGYNVVGIDIAEQAIETAAATARDNPFKQNFGSLEYRVVPFLEMEGTFDVILFGGTLHHFTDLDPAMRHTGELMANNAIVVAFEPCHEKWRIDDAAQVALIRGLLSITGHWYEAPGEGNDPFEVNGLSEWIHAIHTEYLLERDKIETGGQSPHDLSSSGDDIIDALKRYYDIIETRPGVSFIYRMLGGLRGDDGLTRRIADFLATYDQLGIASGFLRPNSFFIAARRS